MTTEQQTAYEHAKVLAQQSGYEVFLRVTNSGWRVLIDHTENHDCRSFTVDEFIAWTKSAIEIAL